MWLTGLVISVLVLITSLELDFGFAGLVGFIFSEFIVCMFYVDLANPLRQGCRIKDPNAVRAAANKSITDKAIATLTGG